MTLRKTRPRGRKQGGALAWALSPAILAAALLALLAPAPPAARAAGAPPRRRQVLILNSYEPTYGWTANVVSGMQAVLGARADVQLHIEYMDSKKAFSPAYVELLSRVYAVRYAGVRFDLILSSDDDALDFLKQQRDRLFPGVPVVFCGVNNFRDERIAGFADVTGVNEESDLNRNLAWVARVRPSTRRIVFVFDGSATSASYLPRVRAAEPSWRHRFELRVLPDATIAELERELRALPADAAVFWGMFMRDRNGTPLSMGESHRIIVGASPVPVFGFTDVSVSHGAVGGYVVSGFTQGQTAARLGTRILDGARAADIPVVKTSPNVYMADYQAFARWHLDVASLPPGTVVLNQPFSFYQRYRRQVWAALGGMLAESLAILALVGAIRTLTRKNRARLRASEQRYRSIVEDGSELICRFDPAGKIVFANDAVARLGDQAAAALVGRPVRVIWGASAESGVMRQVEALTPGRPVIAIEQETATRTGARRWVLWTFRALFTEDEKLAEVQAVGHDITARREAELALARAHGDLTGVLESMREALVVCDGEGKLTRLHSRAAAAWLGAPPEGARVWDYLFPAGDGGWFRAAVEQALDDVLPFEVAAAQLPRTLRRGARTYRLDCHQLLRGGQSAGLVMVLADVTEELEREELQRLHRELPEIVGNLLRDRDGFQAFVDESEQLLGRLQVADDPAEMRRLLHTLKGNTASYGFDSFAARCHALEDVIESDPGESAAEAAAPAGVEALAAAWRAGLGAFGVFLDDPARATIRLAPAEHADLLRRLEAREDHGHLLALARSWAQPPVAEVLGIHAHTVRQIAARLGKEVELRLDDHGLRLPAAELRGFLSALVHVVRNAVDHGIEHPAERAQLGKPRAGTVIIESRLEGPELVIVAEDDGRGVDWEAVRRRAQARGLPAATERDLGEALFADGLTTRDNASDVSGRGVGLGAVRQACANLGGTARVQSRPGAGTRFEFRFLLAPAAPAAMRASPAADPAQKSPRYE